MVHLQNATEQEIESRFSRVGGMKTQVKKNLFGVYQVKFDCPSCNTRLAANLSEAGNVDQCPDCSAEFITPGSDALKTVQRQKEQEEAKKQAEMDAAQAIREERIAEQTRIKEERAAVLLEEEQARKDLAAYKAFSQSEMKGTTDHQPSENTELTPLVLMARPADFPLVGAVVGVAASYLFSPSMFGIR